MEYVFKCKMCGATLDLTQGSSVAKCEYCGSVQTVPKADDEKKLLQFERAERLRKQCEFDKAAGIYENIVADFRDEAEAYWGLVLCRYGIEYVDDPATGKKIPTCHRSGFDSVMDDSDLEQTLENADAAARKIYREEAKVIEELRKGIIAVSAKEDPYDIFICYKETDENGERTLDSVLAQDVYEELTQRGYRVFFSRISLEDKLGEEYEPYIFAALHSARIMLAFGTDYEHFNAVWVKNEWGRYLKLMAQDKTKYLIPCYKGIDAYDMPKEFARLQAQDMGKVGATQDLMRGISKILGEEKADTSIAAKTPWKEKSVWADSWRKKLLTGACVANYLVVLMGMMVLFDLPGSDRLESTFRKALFLDQDMGGGLFTVGAWLVSAILMTVAVAKKKPEKFLLLPMGLYTFSMLFALTSVGPDYISEAVIYGPNFAAALLCVVFILTWVTKKTGVADALENPAKVCLILGTCLALFLLVAGNALAFICINLMLSVSILTSFALWRRKKR